MPPDDHWLAVCVILSGERPAG